MIIKLIFIYLSNIYIIGKYCCFIMCNILYYHQLKVNKYPKQSPSSFVVVTVAVDDFIAVAVAVDVAISVVAVNLPCV